MDEKAGTAQSSADRAGAAASAADQHAMAASQSAETANNTAAAVQKEQQKLIYEVVLDENEGDFKFGDASLPDTAKAAIDALVSKIKADPKGAYFEIEGHTDNVGDKAYNQALGLERANAVKMYLYEQHQIPLFKMNVISYGETKPVAANNTREGRAKNRRVVIRVLD